MAKFLDDNGLAYLWSKIKATIPKAVNPNLLDNWYFGNPVNQRGVSSGAAGWSDYYLDRWIGMCTYTVEQGYLEISADSWLIQRLENGGDIPFPVTFSILFQDGTLSAVTAHESGSVNMEGAQGDVHFIFNVDVPYIAFQNTSQSSVGIVAVKLELGKTQTLAHQDSSGNWVLNEIPDYTEQLLRCLRYCFVASTGGHMLGPAWPTSTTDAYAVINVPVPLRVTPVMNSDASFALRGNGTETSVTSKAVNNKFGSSVTLYVAATGLAARVTYGLRSNGKLILSADL